MIRYNIFAGISTARIWATDETDAREQGRQQFGNDFEIGVQEAKSNTLIPNKAPSQEEFVEAHVAVLTSASTTAAVYEVWRVFFKHAMKTAEQEQCADIQILRRGIVAANANAQKLKARIEELVAVPIDKENKLQEALETLRFIARETAFKDCDIDYVRRVATRATEANRN